MSMGRGFEGVPEELGGMLVGLEMGEFDEPRAAAPAPLVVSGTPAGASRSAALFGAQPAVAQASVALVGSEKLELLQLADRRLLGDLARSTREAFGVDVSIVTPDGVALVGEAPNASEKRYREVRYDGQLVAVVHVAPAEGQALDDATAERVLAHVATVLELVGFSGHRALLASRMHVASIHEAFEQLQRRTSELQAAYDQLRELDRLKSAFLANVSHELRTPLTSIMGFSDLLAQNVGGKLSEEQHGFVRTILEKSDHLLDLITSLLDLAKLESGTVFIRPGPTRVRALLDEVCSTVSIQAGKRGVSVRLECDPTLMVVADARRLRQVFVNLADNAVKFTPTGGTVTLSAREVEVDLDDDGAVLLAPVQRAVEVRVADTGIGIPEAERGKVFEPFYQVDPSATREHGGAGLGLAIVHRIVDAHGGTITIEGNAPVGTVFVVVLPTSTLESGAPVRISSRPPSSRGR
jgi:two-component system sensor histidine kinase BarA